MGRRVHLPIDGRKVGLLRIDDPRAKWARIRWNGIDVTKGFGEPNAEGLKDPVVAAHDGEGWIAVLSRETRLISERRGDVRITWEPSS